MSGPAKHWEQSKDMTIYIGNLDERVSDQLVWELFIQMGRIDNIHLPKDRVTQTHQGFGFVTFKSEEDAEYAAKILNQIRLFGKPMRVNKASADKQKTIEIGAELFVGNLDGMVDEKTLYDAFHRFGPLISVPKIARDEQNLSKGYGFVSFADFDSSDAAIANMNGQVMINKEITVQYAYKKDGKGERHGDEVERTLAQAAKAHGVAPPIQPLPPQLFQVPVPEIPTGPSNTHMMNGDGRGMPGGSQGPGGYGGPPRPPASLPPPPSGLPARPPSGAPPTFYPPPGFHGGPPGGGTPGFMQGPPGGPMPPNFGPPGHGPPGHGPGPYGTPPPGFHRR
ncbi:RNA-binding domain-containing protein [Polyplosphaeria fusca]|uniref:RNA-binding domain-containing protein n=1 Tax=Polyplosphaeria fusca TaxID=682080 RepID=A0A9P4R1N0_9PLEO|nr:RNA-binding domain-containing protein [Polyplosphaeria fusca]